MQQTTNQKTDSPRLRSRIEPSNGGLANKDFRYTPHYATDIGARISRLTLPGARIK